MLFITSYQSSFSSLFLVHQGRISKILFTNVLLIHMFSQFDFFFGGYYIGVPEELEVMAMPLVSEYQVQEEIRREGQHADRVAFYQNDKNCNK